MAQLFEVLFYDGYQQPPVDYLIDGITGETPERTLKIGVPKAFSNLLSKRNRRIKPGFVHSEADVCRLT